MTSNTIRHIRQLEWRRYLTHRLKFAVTFLAWNILQNVGLMIEIDEIRENIDFRPSDGLFLIPRFADFLHFGPSRGNELVATDAGLDRRNHRRSSSPRPAVAILAAHLILARMDFVTECDRLARL
jgi:hypothetical protein